MLLLYYTREDGHNLYLRPEPKVNSTRRRVWNIIQVKRQLGGEVCRHVLFIHALLGCDTTSSLFGIGKGASLKKLSTSDYFQQQAKIFDNESSTSEEITAAGENALVCIYGGKHGQNLNQLRYQRYIEKLASKKSSLQAQSLPPSSGAAKYHSLRVYFQIMEWKEKPGMHYGDWGWRRDGEHLTPVMTDQPPAPQSILKIVRCNCTLDCSTSRCSCRKNNLQCSLACGHCKGSSCTNSPAPILDEESE